MLGAVMTTGWKWAIGGVIALLVVDVVLAVAVNKATRRWWTDRRRGPDSGWPPRKRSAAVLLIGVNLLIALMAVGRLLEASAAITAVTGALGGAALTQWNQRGQAEREADDRRDEREETSRQRSEDREEAARRREEDRNEAAQLRVEGLAERRAEWVRERRFAAYENMLERSMTLITVAADVAFAGKEYTADHQARLAAAAAAWVTANGQLEVYGSEAARAALGPAGVGVPIFEPGPLNDEQKAVIGASVEFLSEHRRRFAEIAASEVDELLGPLGGPST